MPSETFPVSKTSPQLGKNPSRRQDLSRLHLASVRRRSLAFALTVASLRYYGNTMATLTFKVTDEEARQIRARARKERVTVSEYLRRRASMPLVPAGKPAKVRCPHTGAMIFAASEHEPALTTEAVRELLADFP